MQPETLTIARTLDELADDDILGHALYYATRRHWSVLPVFGIRDGRCTCGEANCLHAGKHPLTTDGEHAATTNVETILDWYRRWPDANLAVATGPSRLCVCDLDSPDALAYLCRLTTYDERRTPTVETPNDEGQHVYLDRGDHCMPSTQGRIAENFDLRGSTGYVVVPPSLGANGRRYSWAYGHSPDDLDLQPLPERLVSLFGGRSTTKEPTREFSIARLDGVIGEGRRNDIAFRTACALRRRGVSTSAILSCLVIDNSERFRPPLSEQELQAIVESSSRYDAESDEVSDNHHQPRRITADEIGVFYGNVTWSWPSWIPNGHVTMVAGPQGVGKSYFLAYLMASFTGAIQAWPDGQPVTMPTGPVLLVDSEEMRGSYGTRLAQLGVDPRLWYCPAPHDGSTTYRPSLPKDLDLIARLALEDDCSAVMVDSLSGSHQLDENSAHMRTLLQHLVELATDLQKPVLCSHHTRKRSVLEAVRLSLDRIRGSSTLSQFCRSVIGAYRLTDHDANAPVRVESLKNSFDRAPDALGYYIDEHGLHMCEPPSASDTETLTALDVAATFLQTELAKGPRSVAELTGRAAQHGISRRTLFRAKAMVPVVTQNSLWLLSETLPMPTRKILER